MEKKKKRNKIIRLSSADEAAQFVNGYGHVDRVLRVFEGKKVIYNPDQTVEEKGIIEDERRATHLFMLMLFFPDRCEPESYWEACELMSRYMHGDIFRHRVMAMLLRRIKEDEGFRLEAAKQLEKELDTLLAGELHDGLQYYCLQRLSFVCMVLEVARRNGSGTAKTA